MAHSGDNSAEALEDQRDDLRNEVIELHATLKRLDNNLDFTAIIIPLLADLRWTTFQNWRSRLLA